MDTLNIKTQVRQAIRVKRISKNDGLFSIVDRFIKYTELGPVWDAKSESEYYPDSALSDAVYGIAHAVNTGRLDGTSYFSIKALSGTAALGLIESVAKKRLSGDDVSRFLNGHPFKLVGDRWIASY